LPDQPGDVPYTCADVAKAKHMLGYTSLIPFEEGIRRTAEWYKKTYAFDDNEAEIVEQEIIRSPVSKLEIMTVV